MCGPGDSLVIRGASCNFFLELTEKSTEILRGGKCDNVIISCSSSTYASANICRVLKF